MTHDDSLYAYITWMNVMLDFICVGSVDLQGVCAKQRKSLLFVLNIYDNLLYFSDFILYTTNIRKNIYSHTHTTGLDP